MKIALGSAQFGLSYGVANAYGKVTSDEIATILDVAVTNNIDTLDTAIAYGDSETALGSAGVDQFKVISKLPNVPEYTSDIFSWVHEEVKASLNRLKVKSLDGLLIHNPDSLLGSKAKELVRSLESLKALGIVRKVGVSIYDPYILNNIADVMDLDLVQAPLNIIDRRLITSGWLEKLGRMGVEIHTRSSFLQGLLLLPRDKIPSRFEIWSSLWDFWHYELQKKGLNPITECLMYALSVSQIDRVVVGVETATQFSEIIGLAAGVSSEADWSSMVRDDERLINPSSWEHL